jgi:hypothetical protein
VTVAARLDAAFDRALRIEGCTSLDETRIGRRSEQRRSCYEPRVVQSDRLTVYLAELLRDVSHRLVRAHTSGIVVHLLGEVVGVEARKPRKRPARIALAVQAMTAEAGSAGSAWPTSDGNQVPAWNRDHVDCA